MKASIDLSAVADQLAKCKPGDEYSVTFVVDTKSDNGLTGTASEIEHLDGDYDDDEDDAVVAEGRMPKSGSKVPKAILLVSK